MPVQWHRSAWDSYEPRYVLASVLQGESRTPEGQLAVATVMQNRLADGSWGSSFRSVVTPSQFNGWRTPGPEAFSVADQLLAGTLPWSRAGNALFFGAPSPTDRASWLTGALARGEGTLIGGNTFFANDKGDAITQRLQAALPDPFKGKEVSLPGGAGGKGKPMTSPAPLKDILGFKAPKERYTLPEAAKGKEGEGKGQLVYGLWEEKGAEATTQAGKDQAKAIAESGNTQAEATKAGAQQQSESVLKASEAENTTRTQVEGAREKTSQGLLDQVKDLFQRFFIGATGIVLIGGVVWFFVLRPASPDLKRSVAASMTKQEKASLRLRA